MPDIVNIKAHPHARHQSFEKTPHPEAPPSPYAELLTTTNFSFLRGASHPEELIAEAAKLQYGAIAITDLHSLAGVVRAHVAAKELGVKLLIGAQILLYRRLPHRDLEAEALFPESLEPPDDSLLLPFSLFLYPTDRAAYGRLCKLLTRGKLRAPKGDCWLLLEDLPEFAPGLLAIAAVRDGQAPDLEEGLMRLKEIFSSDRLSLALWRVYGTAHEEHEERIAEVSEDLHIPLVATNDVHYHVSERRMLQDVLTCIRLRCTLDQAGFSLFANAERYLKTPREMQRLFRRRPQAIERAIEIAGRIRFSLDELQYHYPHEICPDGKTPHDYLRELARQGAAERYPRGVPPKVVRQVQHELQLIRELKYEQYFLTVYDIVRFAREQKILHQGRGAAANSALCYLLGITAVDPDRINLLFERFISKERNEPPDIDIDFEHERREEVLQYLYTKYGRHRAALVSEVISYRRRSAIRDIAKTFSLSLDAIENLVKAATRFDSPDSRPSGVPTIWDLMNAEKQRYLPEILDEGNSSFAVLGQILELSNILVGFPRHLSQHVGGMIISEQDLSEIVPIENAAMDDRTIIEWDKDDIDAMGMLKIDLLCLGMLTCIRKAFDLVNTNPALARQTPLTLAGVPPEDPKIYDMLCQADTVGVFQIESRAQMSMLPRLRPRCFYDLVIEVAIVRPGPIQGGMVHPYLRRRAGKEPVVFPDERVRGILSRTLGVPIFQEQAMQLAIVAAGFTPGEADQLRRAMASWKRHKNMIQKFEEKLVGGMIRNGYSAEFAQQCFNQINGFGEYGFPQSHAASFALLVYVSAWLKRHCPAAFAAALINSQPMGFYQPAQILDDAKRHGVRVLPVDANYSAWDCTLEGGAPALRLGMRLARGFSAEHAERIRTAVEQQGRFRTISELWRASGVPASALRCLARADGFSSFGVSRQQALWEIQKLRDERLPLFDGVETAEPCVALPPESKLRQVVHDYNATGLSLKAHPLSFLRAGLEEDGAVTSAQLRSALFCPDGRMVRLAGAVLVRQRPGTAGGVVFLTVEDETGIANLIVFPQVFQQFRQEICDSVFLYVLGRVQREDGITHLIVERAKPLGLYGAEIGSLSRDFH